MPRLAGGYENIPKERTAGLDAMGSVLPDLNIGPPPRSALYCVVCPTVLWYAALPRPPRQRPAGRRSDTNPCYCN